MAFIGPISGSDSLVAITGSVVIADATVGEYPAVNAQRGNTVFFVSGSPGDGPEDRAATFGGDLAGPL